MLRKDDFGFIKALHIRNLKVMEAFIKGNYREERGWVDTNHRQKNIGGWFSSADDAIGESTNY